MQNPKFSILKQILHIKKKKILILETTVLGYNAKVQLLNFRTYFVLLFFFIILKILETTASEHYAKV